MKKKMVLEGKVLKWGNSYGVRLSKSQIEEFGIAENDILKFDRVEKRNNPLKDLFGQKKLNLTRADLDELRNEELESKWLN